MFKKINLEIQFLTTIEYTQPYWLKEKGTEGMYTVSNQENIGIPDIIQEVKVVFNMLKSMELKFLLNEL